MTAHDRLFKELLTTFFVEFVELFLPDVAEYLDRDSLQFLDKELFTDVTSGDRHEADVVVRARFRGEDAFFLIHVENQATREPEFGRRMFRYFARLLERHSLPVYPVALFSYDKPMRAEPNTFTVEFPDFVVNQFAFRVIQLNRLNWREFVNQKNPVASALMAKMRIAEADRPRVKLECLRLLVSLKLTPAKMQLIAGFVDSYLRLGEDEHQTLLADLREINPLEQEEIMAVRYSFREYGIQEGEARIILGLLRKRFGLVPPELEDRISRLPIPSRDIGIFSS